MPRNYIRGVIEDDGDDENPWENLDNYVPSIRLEGNKVYVHAGGQKMLLNELSLQQLGLKSMQDALRDTTVPAAHIRLALGDKYAPVGTEK